MEIAAFKVKSRNLPVLTFIHSDLNIWSYRSPIDANSILLDFWLKGLSTSKLYPNTMSYEGDMIFQRWQLNSASKQVSWKNESKLRSEASKPISKFLLNRQPTMPLPIQKSAIKLRRCWFRNRQSIVPLQIQKSATKNYVVVDLEIGSQKLFHCRFKNQQQNCVAADSEIDSQQCHCRFRIRLRWWSHFGFISLFFGCLHSPLLIKILSSKLKGLVLIVPPNSRANTTITDSRSCIE
jgi:hypothetical protein